MTQLLSTGDLLALPREVTTFFTPPSISDWSSAALIGVCFVGLIAVAELWRNQKNPPVEWTRKLVHFGGGLVCLSFPILIQSHWVVLSLAVSMGFIFVVSKKKKWLQSIHGIERKSSGSEFYPVVVYLCFVLSNGLVWKFVICMLVLAVSDSVAALIGNKFGRLWFRVEEEHKSVAGCFAFFIVTFVSVLGPLLLWDPLASETATLPVWHYVLTASLIGLLVMCIELVSLKGSDNLWVPLGTLLVLTKSMQTDVYDLAIQNLSFTSLLIAVIAVAFISKAFNAGGSILFGLSSYSCWAMGSFDWALPIFIGYALYLILFYVAQVPWSLRVRSVLYNALVPFLILAVANLFLTIERFDIYQFLFMPFLAAVCVSLAQAFSNLLGWKFRRDLRRRMVIGVTVANLVVLSLFLPAIFREVAGLWPNLIWLCVVTTILAVTSSCVFKPLPPGEAPPVWLYVRSGFALLAGVSLLLLQMLGWVEIATVM
ncbi:MAG: diacylglycerol/polyprenol kinase family protein [Mariniblastus sp.]